MISLINRLEGRKMADLSKIFCIRIMDLLTGSTIIQRKYNGENQEIINPETIFSTIGSFKSKSDDGEAINTILMKNRKVLFETTDNLVFIVIVDAGFNTHEATRVLSHIRAIFLRKYPIRDCSWQFDDEIKYFKEFEQTIDEIVNHFGEIKPVLKIVIMGLDYAGKTTLTHAFAGARYQDYIPTTGLDILKLEYRKRHIRLWDLGGQRMFRKLWPRFANEASGIIFVVDSVSTRWVETKKVFDLSRLFKIPYIIFANKQDLVDRAQSIDSIAERLQVPKDRIVMGSALLNKGIYETLDKLLDEIVGDLFF